MMFSLQKLMLVVLFNTLFISSIITNLQLSSLDNVKNKNLKNKPNENQSKNSNKEVSLIEKKSEIKRTPVN